MLRRSKPVKNEPRRKQGVQGANKSSVFSYRSNRNSRSTQTSRPRVDSFDNNIKVKNRNIKHIPTLIAVFVIIIS
ncbi:hypothetical protein KDA00_03540, partial [Candidatus Saccharibacteria bacterium]|nr:hypothetical protein [Candidatus Saccharibacteria bacterium]